MQSLLLKHIPHAPDQGLFVSPSIPEKRVNNAVHDYAHKVDPASVLVLYDGTLLGNGKDGAVFTADRMVFQNSDLSETHEVFYSDIVGVRCKQGLVAGPSVRIDVNRGWVTVSVKLDLSANPKSAPYIESFLKAAMLAPEVKEMVTNWEAVIAALDRLRNSNQLTQADYEMLLNRRKG